MQILKITEKKTHHQDGKKNQKIKRGVFCEYKMDVIIYLLGKNCKKIINLMEKKTQENGKKTQCK